MTLSFAAIIMLGTNDCKAVFDATVEEDYVSPSRFDDEHINAEGHGILAEAIYRTLTDSFLQTG